MPLLFPQTERKINKELPVAEEILEADHYGLKKVKERILEYLAVQHRVKKVRGPILCFVGSPGVGKTSLGKTQNTAAPAAPPPIPTRPPTG